MIDDDESDPLDPLSGCRGLALAMIIGVLTWFFIYLLTKI